MFYNVIPIHGNPKKKIEKEKKRELIKWLKIIQVRWKFTIKGKCVESDGTKQRL